MISLIPLFFVIAVVVATVALGVWATKASKTASDFFVAGRSVNVFWNASAISGEYLSAASFMGIAGLVMKHGYDALWYPVGYALGYLFLLLFIAGPLRRFGAYTIPDFAEGRFDSPTFRQNRCPLCPRHWLLLHDAADEGRGRHHVHHHGVALLGRNCDCRRRYHLQCRPRRHEGHHNGAGVPVLGEGVRHRCPLLRPQQRLQRLYGESERHCSEPDRHSALLAGQDAEIPRQG